MKLSFTDQFKKNVDWVKRKADSLQTQAIHDRLLNPTPIEFEPNLILFKNSVVKVTAAESDDDEVGKTTVAKPYSHTAKLTYETQLARTHNSFVRSSILGTLRKMRFAPSSSSSNKSGQSQNTLKAKKTFAPE
jgi:hypothetical protein